MFIYSNKCRKISLSWCCLLERQTCPSHQNAAQCIRKQPCGAACWLRCNAMPVWQTASRAGIMLNCMCSCNLGHFRKDNLAGWLHFLWHFSYQLQFSENQAAVRLPAGTDIWAEPRTLFTAKVLKQLSSWLFFWSARQCVWNMIYVMATQQRTKNSLLCQFFSLWSNVFIHRPPQSHKTVISSTLYFTTRVNSQQGPANHTRVASNLTHRTKATSVVKNFSEKKKRKKRNEGP